MFPLNKYRYYTNGKKVIAVSSYAGKPVRGTANCSSDDRFNFEIGKKIAAARCNLKVAEKRLDRAYDKWMEAENLFKEIGEYCQKMHMYYIDSRDQHEMAENELNDLLDTY